MTLKNYVNTATNGMTGGFAQDAVFVRQTGLKLNGQQKPGKEVSYEKTACGFCWYGSAHCSDLYRVATIAPVWILPGMQLGRARKVRLPGLLQLE